MFIVYLNNASWEKGEAPKGKKCVSRHLSSFELLIRMVGENVSGQSIKKCHKIFLSSQLYMSRNVFEITLLGIIVCRGVNKEVCSRVLCLNRWLCTPHANGVCFSFPIFIWFVYYFLPVLWPD